MNNRQADHLLKIINDRSAVVGIIGLGYVGLPLALAFTEKGFRVLGFDVDRIKVDKINRGDCYIKHLDPTRLTRAVGSANSNARSEENESGKSEIRNPKSEIESGKGGEIPNSSFLIPNSNPHDPNRLTRAVATPTANPKANDDQQLRIENSKLRIEASASPLLEATDNFERMSEPDAVLICVPTPLGPHKEPDLSYVENSTRAIRHTLREGQLIILESTTYPGTTDDLLRPILEGPHDRRETAAGGGAIKKSEIRNSNSEIGSGASDEKLKTQNSKLKTKKCGEHFFLAFSPEREDPGNKDFGTTNVPKVVGGVDEVSGDLAQALYDQIIDSTVRVASARIAEASKLTENIFRSVNIALVNELKIIYDRLGIDVWDVLDAAETKPFGFMRFNPGPGLGGHCIPLDPFYLAWRAREAGVPTRFIELAGEINTAMPAYVIDRLKTALNDREKAAKGSKILVLGLAYKPNIDDPRESPAFEIIDLLLELGADVSYHDPHIPEAPSMRSWPDLPPMKSVDLSAETLQETDAALIITDHKAVDYDLVLEHAPLIIDTRGVYRHKNGKVHSA